MRDWIESIRTGRKPIEDARFGHHAALVGHMCNLSYKAGKPVRWNKATRKVDLIYFPMRAHEVTPAGLGLAHQELELRTEDGERLHGWWSGPSWGAAHAARVSRQRGQRGDRLDPVLLMQARPASTSCCSTTGATAQRGRPGEAGTYRDARARGRAGWRATKSTPSAWCYSGSRSGGGWRCNSRSRSTPRALVLESTFTTSPRWRAPCTPSGRRGRRGTRYPNVATGGRPAHAAAVVHGERDEIVPFGQGRRVFDAAPEPKRLFVIRGVGHNDTYTAGGELYWRVLRDFLEGLSHA